MQHLAWEVYTLSIRKTDSNPQEMHRKGVLTMDLLQVQEREKNTRMSVFLLLACRCHVSLYHKALLFRLES